MASERRSCGTGHTNRARDPRGCGELCRRGAGDIDREACGRNRDAGCGKQARAAEAPAKQVKAYTKRARVFANGAPQKHSARAVAALFFMPGIASVRRVPTWSCTAGEDTSEKEYSEWRHRARLRLAPTARAVAGLFFTPGVASVRRVPTWSCAAGEDTSEKEYCEWRHRARLRLAPTAPALRWCGDKPARRVRGERKPSGRSPRLPSRTHWSPGFMRRNGSIGVQAHFVGRPT